MLHLQIASCLGACLLLLALTTPGLTFSASDEVAVPTFSLEQGYHMKARRTRGLLQDDTAMGDGSTFTVRGLPARFTLRPMIDPSLCVNRVLLTAAAVVRARARSGLPPTGAEELAEYGASRLVLLPCSSARTETFLAEAVLGRFYQNNAANYRQGFLKIPSDLGSCAYGVNHTYTDGHPVFGVTGTQFYAQTSAKTQAAKEYDLDDDNTMDWYDDYTFNYAPYVRYGYDPNIFLAGTFRSPNPLPVTMLDASGWGPFHASWGPCMANPTLDTATPTDTADTEAQLRFMSWIFIDVPETNSTSHLPAPARSRGYAIATLGPDRPQPDMSPDAGLVDAGELSAALGGGDKPYGTGYSSLVSNELCMTASVIKEGAEVRLARCNPVAPTLEQVFQLAAVTRAKVARLAK